MKIQYVTDDGIIYNQDELVKAYEHECYVKEQERLNKAYTPVRGTNNLIFGESYIIVWIKGNYDDSELIYRGLAYFSQSHEFLLTFEDANNKCHCIAAKTCGVAKDNETNQYNPDCYLVKASDYKG